MPDRSRSTRALDVLERVASSAKPLRVADIVEICRLPKASAHRICRLLRARGYIRAEVDGRGMVPGPRLRSLAGLVIANQSESAARHAVLEAVTREIGETCTFAVPDGTAMVYVDRAAAGWSLNVQIAVGARVPLHCSAIGKLYLASMAPARRRRLIRRLVLEPHTANTIVDHDRLEAAAEEAAARDMATNDEEFVDGIVGVAVPVRTAKGGFLGTLSFHSPVARMSLAAALVHLDALRRGADELGREIADDVDQ